MNFLNAVPVLHSGMFMAIIAHGLIGLTLVWDKVLLRRPETTSLPAYVFWLGAISVFGLVLIFFGFHFPSLWVIVVALLAGFFNLASAYCYYAALKAGEVSQMLAIVGGFSPIATALIGIPLLKKQIAGDALIGFALLTAGGFVMFLSERVNVRKMAGWIASAAAAFGMTHVLQKVAFDNTNFVSGYVFFTIGTALSAAAMLLRPSWRREIFQTSEQVKPRSRELYFVNRFVNGVGSFLVFYAISLTNPALVDAITAVRYVVIFLAAFAITHWRPDWLRENFNGLTLVGKIAATLLVAAGLVWLALNTGETGSSRLAPEPHSPATATRSAARPRPPG